MELRQPRNQPSHGEGGVGLHPQSVDAAPAGQSERCFTNPIEMVRHHTKIALTLRCQYQLARRAAEEARAEIELKARDLPADGTGRDQQFLRRPPDAAQSPGGFEGSQ